MDTLAEFESKEYDLFKISFSSIFDKIMFDKTKYMVDLYKFIQYDGSDKSLEQLYSNSIVTKMRSVHRAQTLLRQPYAREVYDNYISERKIRIEAFNLNQSITPQFLAAPSPIHKI